MNHFASTLVQATLERDLLGPNIALLQETYTERVQALTTALRTRLEDTVSFAVPGLFTNALRISFALYEVDELEQAVARLSQTLAAYPG